MVVFSEPKHILKQVGVSSGMCVVDLGAGSGGYSIVAADFVGEDGVVYAVDIQKNLLKRISDRAKSLNGDVEVVWADLEKDDNSTGLNSGVADIVIIANVLFQLENKDKAFKEAHRLLKEKGRVLVVDWSDSHGGLGPVEAAVFPEANARQLAETVGFTVERDIDAGKHHYGFIARKK